MLRVLVIDDDHINNFTVGAMLKRVPFVDEYEITNGGAKALAFLKEVNQTEQFPTTIFVDINMPEMDGYEFLKHYEEDFMPNHKSTKVHMLSSSISEVDISKSLSYESVSEYVTKPLTRMKLKELIGEPA